MSDLCLQEAPPQDRSKNSETRNGRRIFAAQGLRGIVLLLVTVLIVAASSLWHVKIIDRDMASTHSDLLPRWVGTRDALRGVDPYSTEGLRDIQTAYYGRPVTPADHVDPQAFLYPPHILVLFAGLAPFSWEQVRLAFLLVMPPLIAISVLLCIRWTGVTMSRARMLMAVVFSLLSWPMMWGLRLQQPTLLVAVVVFAACYLLKRGDGIAAGILLAMATVKPQLVAPLIAWLLIWAFLKRSWGLFAGFGITMAVLLLWAERILPGGFTLWRKSLTGYSQFTHTQLCLEMIFGHWLGLTVTALICVWSGILVWRLRRCSADSSEFGLAVALILAATVFASPTKMPMIYNQVLLIPALLILIDARPQEYYTGLARRMTLALLVWGFAAVPIALAGESFSGHLDLWSTLPFQNLLLPVVATVAVALHAFTVSSRLEFEEVSS